MEAVKSCADPSKPQQSARPDPEAWGEGQANNAADDDVPAGVVRQRAVELGLGGRMLRRLSGEGLLAVPRQRGLGYRRGTVWSYPRRSLPQLEAVAANRAHRISPPLLRHRVWWRPGGQLEDWLRWQQDRVEDLTPSDHAWDLTPAFGDFPEDREAAMTDLAASWGDRHPPLPGGARTVRGNGDRETLARLFFSLVLKDDLMTALVGAEDPADARARLQAVLGEQVDGEVGEDRGISLGELLERGFGKPAEQTLPGVPGELFVAMFAYFPDPHTAAAEIAALSEERAATARDGLIAWATRAQRGLAAQLSASPPLAGLMTLWWDRLSAFVPSVANGPDAGVSRAAS
jgi:hypothetical protein